MAGDKQVTMKTLQDCKLAIGPYPYFTYDASEGGAQGTATGGTDGDESKVYITFDTNHMAIPPLSFSTTKILGIVPLPPPLKISILPRKLQGYADLSTGEVRLEFDAMFECSFGWLFKAMLSVVTQLTSECSHGDMHHAKGKRLGKDGKCRLVGVARVPSSASVLLNTLLMLPTDALAELSAELHFNET